MNFEIIPTPHFQREVRMLVKRHRSLKKDLEDFTEDLRKNPFQGVELSPGIRKIRMAISSKGRGKSGGARIITFTVVAALPTDRDGEVYLMEIYDKADHSAVDLGILLEITQELQLGNPTSDDEQPIRH